jgi:hypothetical protein
MDNDNDPYIMAFNKIVTCLPVHNYVINSLAAMVTYYCGLNNTFTLPFHILPLPPLEFQEDIVRRQETLDNFTNSDKDI